MTFIYFSEEQKVRAASVNLEEFLRLRGEKLIRSGREQRLESDHSVTVRGNAWYDHASGEGGGPVSFVRTRYNLSYPEAVTLLLDGSQGLDFPRAGREEKIAAETKPFALPPAHRDMRRVYAYLTQKRCIAREVVSHFARAGTLYESRELSPDGRKEYHNAVFAGYDEHGVPRHAHKRGLYSEGKPYKGNAAASEAAYSFHYAGASTKLYVFEAPVDLLSYLTLYPDNWREHSCVALCGTAQHAMLKRLELTPRLNDIVLCLDNDEAGVKAAARLTGILGERGYMKVAVRWPTRKDWNEDLVRARHGILTQRISAVEKNETRMESGIKLNYG